MLSLEYSQTHGRDVKKKSLFWWGKVTQGALVSHPFRGPRTAQRGAGDQQAVSTLRLQELCATGGGEAEGPDHRSGARPHLPRPRQTRALGRRVRGVPAGHSCFGAAPTRRHCVDGSFAPALPCPIAAVVKDSFLEEGWELTDGVFRKCQPHFADVQGRRRRLQHHTEKVPEVFL